MENIDYFESKEGRFFGVTEEDNGYEIFDITSTPDFIGKTSLNGKLVELIKEKGDKYASKNKVKNIVCLDNSKVRCPKLKADYLKRKLGRNYLVEAF